MLDSFRRSKSSIFQVIYEAVIFWTKILTQILHEYFQGFCDVQGLIALLGGKQSRSSLESITKNQNVSLINSWFIAIPASLCQS